MQTTTQGMSLDASCYSCKLLRPSNKEGFPRFMKWNLGKMYSKWKHISLAHFEKVNQSALTPTEQEIQLLHINQSTSTDSSAKKQDHKKDNKQKKKTKATKKRTLLDSDEDDFLEEEHHSESKSQSEKEAQQKKKEKKAKTTTRTRK
ncbi:protein PXR1-like [Camellia sinensis]|uniref:protein PXR1-like n=1 Tax=Camellia sinensis TaxID=4442 RepID=UPI00103584E3|nr:protein PXR1-like [Camellia sinensis]